MTEKERYASIGTWAKYLKKEEGVDVARETIRRHMRKAGIIGETGRSASGKVLTNAFFAESDIRERLSHIIAELSKVDDEGFIVKDGKRYGLVPSLAKEIGVSETLLRRALDSGAVIPTIQGRAHKRERTLYLAEALANLFKQFSSDEIRAGEQGLVVVDGEIYASISALSRKFKVSKVFFRPRIRASNSLLCVRGRSFSSHLCNFYSLAQMTEICSDIVDLPIASKEGFLDIEGVRYGTAGSIARVLGISRNTVINRIKSQVLTSIRGRDSGGRALDFFLVEEVSGVCGELSEDLPKANKEGFLQIDAEQFGTIEGLARYLGVSPDSIENRVLSYSLEPVRGKTLPGHIKNHYSLSEVRDLCADLIAKKSKK